jgi:hypothetical protein
MDEVAFSQGKIHSATFFIDFHLPKSDLAFIAFLASSGWGRIHLNAPLWQA